MDIKCAVVHVKMIPEIKCQKKQNAVGLGIIEIMPVDLLAQALLIIRKKRIQVIQLEIGFHRFRVKQMVIYPFSKVRVFEE